MTDSEWFGQDSCCCRGGLSSLVDEWTRLLAAGRSACAKLPAGSNAYRGQSPRGSLGHVVDFGSDRRHCAWLAQSAELRPCAGDLHVRDHFRDLGCHLPLLRLDSKASDLCVLAARMATVQGTRSHSKFRARHCVWQELIFWPRHSSRNARGLRWAMHQMIFWGCVLAVMITFPLVFGWIHFTSAPNDQMTYVTLPVRVFRRADFICTRSQR